MFKLKLHLYRGLKFLNETENNLIWYSFVALILVFFSEPSRPQDIFLACI